MLLQFQNTDQEFSKNLKDGEDKTIAILLKYVLRNIKI
jgi:hypothetical protein